MNTDIQRMLEITRQRGNTRWILESAIKNPNIIIVSRDTKHRVQLHKDYLMLFEKNLLIEEAIKPWYKKVWNYFFPKKSKVKHPLFITIHDYDRLRGITTPIVFDLHSIC